MNAPHIIDPVLVASLTAHPSTWATTGIPSHYPGSVCNEAGFFLFLFFKDLAANKITIYM